ncbi:hypothetical protein LTR93_012277, partial [Exophiala xenobiotica]
MTIGTAVLGAGIFARDEHVPAIKQCKLLSLKAIYSRSQKSATSLAETAGADVEVYYDSADEPSRTLDQLLARDDIKAVVICLPITVQPEVIRKALSNRKHVFSEKPIAKDAETAEELIEWHARLPRPPIWNVGENFRFIDPMVHGAKKIAELGGEIVTFTVSIFSLVEEDDKFYQTEWRQVPDYQGGFLLDGGVHFVAGLRYLLAAGNQYITRLSAFTTLLQTKLAPLDTLTANVKISNHRCGTFSVSFGIEHKSNFVLEIVTTKGAVEVRPTEVKVVGKDSSGSKTEEKEEFAFSAGVKPEIEAFANGIQSGSPDKALAPREALNDLLILEAILRSGASDGV